MQTVNVPVIDATDGNALTVIVLVPLVGGSPFEVKVKVTVPVKLASGV